MKEQYSLRGGAQRQTNGGWAVGSTGRSQDGTEIILRVTDRSQRGRMGRRHRVWMQRKHHRNWFHSSHTSPEDGDGQTELYMASEVSVRAI